MRDTREERRQGSRVAEANRAFTGRARTVAIQALIPAVLLSLYVVQCVWFIRTQSLTYDEPIHIATGLDAWDNHRFQQSIDHPPLARLLCALPLRGRQWRVDIEPLPAGFRVPTVLPDPESLARRARAVNAGLGALLGCLLWLEASATFSVAAANFALALFAFSPSLIANFSMVTTDGVATLMIFATALQVSRWKQAPTGKNTARCGVVLGLLLLAKFSTLPSFVLAVLWMLTPVAGRLSMRYPWWNWAKAVVAVGIAGMVVWAGYFFHVSRLTIRHEVLTATFPHWTAPLVKPTHSRLNINVPVPAGEFIAGFRDLAFHNAHGQPAFFLGQISHRGGWRTFYPVVILVKWPLTVVVLALAGLLLWLRGKIQARKELWIVFSFPIAYFLLALASHFTVGDRHILPLYPFALLLTAAAWHKFSQWRVGAILLLLLVGFNAVDTVRYAPGYLSYFDIFLPRDSGYRLLSDCNLDWGQGLLALRNYQSEHPNERISLAYFGSVDPAVYGIRARTLAENEHATGTVVVGATNLTGQYLRDPNAYHWVLRYPLVAVLDHSLYVFRADR